MLDSGAAAVVFECMVLFAMYVEQFVLFKMRWKQKGFAAAVFSEL